MAHRKWQRNGSSFAETDLRTTKILAMAGHTDGIITFGKNLQEAGAILLNAMNQR